MLPSKDIQKRLNSDPKYREGFLAGCDFANQQSSPEFQKLWERLIKAEQWSAERAVEESLINQN